MSDRTIHSSNSVDEYLVMLEDDLEEFIYAYCRSTASVSCDFLDGYLSHGRERTLLEIEIAEISEDSSEKIARGVRKLCHASDFPTFAAGSSL
jgi:hypothetical protein